MLGKRNIRDSIGYVTLGLFTHALLDELLEAKSRPENPPHRCDMINLAIESITSIEKPEESISSNTADLVFQNYQEITTLNEALSVHREPSDLRELQEVLNNIVESHVDSQKRGENIKKGIDFFAEVARRAIINAECPEEQVPPGVRQLV